MASGVGCLEKSRERYTFKEKTIQHPTSKNSELFQLFFLENNESQNVEIVETPEIDFEMVVRRLKHGESVFITRKSVQERNLSQSLIDAKEPWYFTHI